ncbi:MAG: OmpA family protein [Myxococcota bacterium]
MATRLQIPITAGMLLGVALCTGCAVAVTESAVNRAALAGLQCIAVLPFANDTRDYRAGDVAAEMLAGRLLVSGHYNIVEPSEVRLILDAQGITYRPPANVEAARAYGEAIGAQAVFGGDVRAYGRSTQAPISLESSLIEVRSGEVLWRGAVVHEDDWASLQHQPVVSMAFDSLDKLVGNLVYERSNLAVSRSVCAKRPSLLKIQTPAPPPSAPAAEAPLTMPTGTDPGTTALPSLPDLQGSDTATDLPSLPDEGADSTAAAPTTEARAYRFAPEDTAPRPELKLSGAQRRLLARLYTGTAQNQRIFKPQTTTLTPMASKLVTDIARLLRAVPELRLAFEVHVDLPGSGERSAALATKQLSVLQALVNKRAGFASDRVFFYAVGNREPLAKDKTARARVQNSRVGVRRVQ